MLDRVVLRIVEWSCKSFRSSLFQENSKNINAPQCIDVIGKLLSNGCSSPTFRPNFSKSYSWTMEHIPQPDHPSCQIRIPYISNVEFDGGELKTYPRRHGWNTSKLLDGDLQGHSEDELAGLLQTWLYFGQLSHILPMLGTEFQQSEFISVDNASGDPSQRVPKYVSSAPLLRYFAQWERDAAAMTSENRREKAMKIQQTLEVASIYARGMLSRASPCKIASLAPPEIILSVHVLGVALFRLTTKLYLPHYGSQIANGLLGWDEFKVSDEDSALASAWVEPYWGVSPLLYDRLVEQGWCRRIIKMLEDIFLPDTLYYVTTLGIKADFDHTNCSELVCSRDNIDNATYETEHVNTRCKCSFLGVDNFTVAEILDKGGVPVLVFDGGIGEPQVVDSPGFSYTAISHVWSHGLGNHHENSLPRCQIRRLCEAAAALQPADVNTDRVVLWIDTLCVPVEDRPRRSTAIARMRKTYQEANAVLVLDKGIQQSTAPNTPDEILTRVACSAWLSRLWTLQEGVLASKLFIQFSDRAINISQLPELTRTPLHLLSNVRTDAGQALSDIKLMQSETWRSSPEVQSLVPLVQALRYRSTSWKRDETTCMSILLDLDVDLILKTSPEDRMRVLLSQIKHIPPTIIFLSGRKLQAPGYRWAPETFLNRSSSTDSHELSIGEPAKRSMSGIEVTFPGFTIRYASTSLQSTFYLINKASREWYKFESESDVFPLEKDTRPWEQTESVQNPAIVLPRIMPEADNESIVCALVSNMETRGDCIIAKFEARAFMSRIDPVIEFDDRRDFLEREENLQEGVIALADTLPFTQKWTIS